MPIRPSERRRYPRDWKQIAADIRKREGDACKWCKAPNGAVIVRKKDPPTDWLPWDEFDSMVPPEVKERDFRPRMTKVVLTVAHLNHIPEDCRDENLVALCQYCHLRYDVKHHGANARNTRRGRKAWRDMFVAQAGEMPPAHGGTREGGA